MLMTDGKLHTIERLDDETVETLSNSDVPIDTIALDPDADVTALRTIADETGGTFTAMEK